MEAWRCKHETDRLDQHNCPSMTWLYYYFMPGSMFSTARFTVTDQSGHCWKSETLQVTLCRDFGRATDTTGSFLSHHVAQSTNALSTVCSSICCGRWMLVLRLLCPCSHLQVTSPLELNLLVEKDYFKLLVSNMLSPKHPSGNTLSLSCQQAGAACHVLACCLSIHA